MSSILYQQFQINSEDCQHLTTSGSNFRLVLKERYVPLPLSQASILSSSFIHTHFNLNDRNNKFSVDEGSGFVGVVLATGNFNASEVEILVKNSLDSLSVLTYTVSISLITGKMTILQNDSTDVILDFDVADSAAEYLGFSKLVLHTMDVSNSWTIESNTTVNLLGNVLSYNVRSGNFDQTFITSQEGAFSDTIYSLPVVSLPFEIQFNDSTNPQRVGFSRSTNALHFRITDDANVEIEARGTSSYSFVIGIWTSPAVYFASITSGGAAVKF